MYIVRVDHINDNNNNNNNITLSSLGNLISSSEYETRWYAWKTQSIRASNQPFEVDMEASLCKAHSQQPGQPSTPKPTPSSCQATAQSAPFPRRLSNPPSSPPRVRIKTGGSRDNQQPMIQSRLGSQNSIMDTNSIPATSTSFTSSSSSSSSTQARPSRAPPPPPSTSMSTSLQTSSSSQFSISRTLTSRIPSSHPPSHPPSRPPPQIPKTAPSSLPAFTTTTSTTNPSSSSTASKHFYSQAQLTREDIIKQFQEYQNQINVRREQL